MSEDNTITEEVTEGLDELTLLKEQAVTLGIKVGNSGVETLRKKIAEKLSGETEEEEDEEEEVVTKKAKVETKAAREARLRVELRKEKMRLMRVKIYNLDPNKRDLHGELITVGNRFLGTVTKMIPFGEATENGYHIPKVLYDSLKRRQFNEIKTKTVNGQIQVSTRWVPEYNLVDLPPLTPEELEELKLNQAAAARVGL